MLARVDKTPTHRSGIPMPLEGEEPMTPKQPQAKKPAEATPLGIRNPYIVNFCRVLVQQKGEHHEPEALKKLLNSMYKLFENMLGQNMVRALPEDVRDEYLKICEDLTRLNYERIGEIFDRHVPDYEAVMKETMKQFAKIFMSNRTFDPKAYPVAEAAGAADD